MGYFNYISSSTGETITAAYCTAECQLIRNGNTSTLIDTFDTTDNIAGYYVLLGGTIVDTGLIFCNTSPCDITLQAGDAGMTLVGNMVVPAHSVSVFSIVGNYISGSSTLTTTLLYNYPAN